MIWKLNLRAISKISFSGEQMRKIFSDTKNIWLVDISHISYYIGLLILNHKFNIRREEKREERGKRGAALVSRVDSRLLFDCKDVW